MNTINLHLLLAATLLTIPALSATPEQPAAQQPVCQHVVIGNRGVAYSIARQLLNNGKPVTVVARNVEKTRKLFDNAPLLTVSDCAVESDATGLATLMKGKKQIFVSPHFPYAVWAHSMIKMAKNIVAGLGDADTTLCFASKAYALGLPPSPEFAMSEAHDANPCSDQGAIFKSVEDIFLRAAREQKCRTIVLRHAHAFGPNVIDGLMDRAFSNALKHEAMQWVYRTDMNFQVAFAPDIAATMLQLANKKSEQRDQLYHFAGQVVYLDTWLADIARAAGNQSYSTDLDGWLKVKFLAPLQHDAQACKDIFYTFEQPIILASTQLEKVITVPHTPMDDAIKQTLTAAQK